MGVSLYINKRKEASKRVTHAIQCASARIEQKGSKIKTRTVGCGGRMIKS